MYSAFAAWEYSKPQGWWKGKKSGRPLITPRVFSLKFGWDRANRTVTCMVLKAMANDRRKNLAPCCDEFRGPRSDVTIDQVA
ncbi:hypothetical protein TNCV_675071 [Trichonephila clavipes]|nr:hypothetical protein TNCV_675071 [Trichonephila clavipes]